MANGKAADTIAALLGKAGPPPPRDSAPAPDLEPEPEPELAPEPAREPEPVPEPAPAPVKARRARPTPAPEPEPEPVVVARKKPPITQFHLPASVFERVREAKDESGDTHEMWFLDAFDAVDDQLDEVYRPRAARRTKMPQRQRRTRRPTTDPLVSYPLRFTDEERKVLEDRIAELRPPSASEFATRVCELRLAQLDKERDKK